MKRSSCLLVVGAALAFSCVSAKSHTPQSDPEQTVFSAEDERVKHPVLIPNEVLAILRGDGLVKRELDYAGIAPENLPASWFSASEIALRSPGERDLIVAAEGPLVGANVDTFWVFIYSGNGYTLVLTIPALGLSVKNSRTNGYRDIEAAAATAVKITTASFRFDGQEYKIYSSKTEDIK